MSADAKRRLEKLVIKKGGFKNMHQKLDTREELDREALRALLLKDGLVYKYSGKEEILNDRDLKVLSDRLVSRNTSATSHTLISNAGVTKHTREPRTAMGMLTAIR